MRIGIFGGTFNPVHIGHIRGAVSVYEAFSLDKVIFVPTGIPPHKKDDVAPAEYRYEMVSLSIEGFKDFYVSDIEIASNTVSYTIDTISVFREKHAEDDIFFVVGTDAFFYFDLWKEYDKLAKMVSFIVMRRPEYDVSPVIKKYGKKIKFTYVESKFNKQAEKECVFIYTPPAFDISSSMIRNKIKRGESIRYLVPEKIEKFIKEKGLYKI